MTLVRVDLFVRCDILYQDLLAQGQIDSQTGLLPPVLPIVLYNGTRKWTGPVELSELIQPVPGSLARYQPNLRFLLIDEQEYNCENLPGGNLVSAIIALEQSRTPEEILQVVRLLADWINAPEQASLRRTFVSWITRVLFAARLKGQEVPEVTELHELDAMLAETVKEWTREWMDRMGCETGLLQRAMQDGIRIRGYRKEE